MPTKVPRRDEPVAPLVPGPATHEHARVLHIVIHSSQSLSASKPSKFHQLQTVLNELKARSEALYVHTWSRLNAPAALINSSSI